MKCPSGWILDVVQRWGWPDLLKVDVGNEKRESRMIQRVGAQTARKMELMMGKTVGSRFGR